MSTVHATSRVRLRPLLVRPEDGEFVVGSLENGEFVAVPEVGRRAIELLGEDRTLAQAGRQLSDEFGAEVDLTDFVERLRELGFVGSIDGRPVERGPVFRPSLPRLRPEHVRWLFRPWFGVLAVAIVVGAAAVLIFRSGPGWPRYDTLLWLDSTGLTIIGNLAMFVALAALHEFAHLAAARSLGLPARFGLSTRLGSLTPVTDVRCLWAVPARRRYRVYLAGMASDLVVLSTAAILGSIFTQLRAPLDALALLAVFTVLSQCQLYLRTDLYLVATTLARTRNLHQDAVVYLLDRLRLGWRRLVGKHRSERPDPLAALPVREVRLVRRYAVVLVAGSAAVIALIVTVGLPGLVALVSRAVASVRGGGWLEVLDGVAVLAVLALIQTLFVVTLLRLGGDRFRRLRDRLR